MSGSEGPQFGRERRREARRDREGARPAVEEVLERIERVEQWFKAPLFECRRCGRAFEAMTEMDVPKKGGYFEFTVRMCRVKKMKDDPGLMWSLDRCIACRPEEKG